MYNTNSQIKFKTAKLKSSLCDYSDVWKLAKGTMTNSIGTTTVDDANKQLYKQN